LNVQYVAFFTFFICRNISDADLAKRTEVLEAVLRCQIHRLTNKTLYDPVIGETDRMPKVKPLSDCLMQARNEQDQNRCVAFLAKVCASYPIVVVKTIRYPLYAITDLIKKLPDVAVVYYVRDPRGIMSSRKVLHNFGDTHMTLFTSNLCDAMSKNHEYYARVQKMFPRNLMFLRYEDLAFDPLATTAKLYEFLGRTIPDEVMQWIKQNTQNEGPIDIHNEWQQARLFETKRNSALAATSWKTKLNNRTKQMIFEKCQHFLELNGYHNVQ
jgi:hypothetical protein